MPGAGLGQQGRLPLLYPCLVSLRQVKVVPGGPEPFDVVRLLLFPSPQGCPKPPLRQSLPPHRVLCCAMCPEGAESSLRAGGLCAAAAAAGELCMGWEGEDKTLW